MNTPRKHTRKKVKCLNNGGNNCKNINYSNNSRYARSNSNSKNTSSSKNTTTSICIFSNNISSKFKRNNY